MKKKPLLLGLFALIFIISAALIFSWNSRFNKFDFITKNYTHREEETNVNDKMIDNMAKYVVVDRFEGNYAVCEDKNGEMINIDRSEIPEEAKEGTVLKIEGDRIEIDHSETTERKNRMLEFIEAIWK